MRFGKPQPVAPKLLRLDYQLLGPKDNRLILSWKNKMNV